MCKQLLVVTQRSKLELLASSCVLTFHGLHVVVHIAFAFRTSGVDLRHRGGRIHLSQLWVLYIGKCTITQNNSF
jgi:hypothetical protein